MVDCVTRLRFPTRSSSICSASLRVDDRRVQAERLIAPSSPAADDSLPEAILFEQVFVGGHAQAVRNFSGCLSHLTLGEDELDLVGGNALRYALNVEPCGSVHTSEEQLRAEMSAVDELACAQGESPCVGKWTVAVAGCRFALQSTRFRHCPLASFL